MEALLLHMPSLGVQHFTNWLGTPEMRYILAGLTRLLEAFDSGDDLKTAIDTKFDGLDD